MNLFKNIALVIMVCTIANASTAQSIPDHDLKKNIAPIANPLEKITLLEPRSFEFNTADYKYLKLPAGSWYGFMSENFQKVFPGLVQQTAHQYPSGKNAYKTATTANLDLEGLIPVLVASIQEQQAQIAALQQSVEALRQQLNR